ncbi:UDP-N-acetylmuramate--alanine ligase, partial [Candidatus Electrothrix marina]
PIEGVNSEALLDAIKRHGQRNAFYHSNLSTLPPYLFDFIQKDDLVLTLGAGSVIHVGETLLELLA